MNLGRGFPVPLEKGVAQNGNIWIPSTPDKPVLQRSNNAQSEIPQNQIEGESWSDLVDMYEDYLRNKQPHKFDLNRTIGLNYREHNNQGFAPVETYDRLQQNSSPTGIVGLKSRVQNSRDVAPVEAYNRLPLNFSPTGCTGVNSVEHNLQDVSILQKFGSLNPNAGRIGSYAQNLGEVVRPQKVNSLAELLGMGSVMRAPPSNGSPNRSTCFVGKPTVICPLSQVESNQVAYASVGTRLQQNHILQESNQVAYATVGEKLQQTHILHANCDVGGYNLQEMTNSEYITCETSFLNLFFCI